MFLPVGSRFKISGSKQGSLKVLVDSPFADESNHDFCQLWVVFCVCFIFACGVMSFTMVLDLKHRAHAETDCRQL